MLSMIRTVALVTKPFCHRDLFNLLLECASQTLGHLITHHSDPDFVAIWSSWLWRWYLEHIPITWK